MRSVDSGNLGFELDFDFAFFGLEIDEYDCVSVLDEVVKILARIFRDNFTLIFD